MTRDNTQEPTELTEDDRRALIRHGTDLSDLPAEVVDEARHREENSYRAARRIADGTLDPMSA